MAKKSNRVVEEVSGLLEAFYKDIKGVFKSNIPRYRKIIEREIRLASKMILNETVAIVGPPAVGKTTFLKVLSDPNTNLDELGRYDKTEAKPYEGFDVNWNIPVTGDTQINFKFKVAAGIDNGGEEYIREGHWLETIQSSNIIFYLFDFERFCSDEFRNQEIERIISDFDWIAGNVNQFKTNFRIIPLGNKADVFCSSLPEFRKVKSEYSTELNSLHQRLIERMPSGYKESIIAPNLLSLLNKRIRNEQFIDLMLSIMGKDLVELFKDTSNSDSMSENK